MGKALPSTTKPLVVIGIRVLLAKADPAELYSRRQFGKNSVPSAPMDCPVDLFPSEHPRRAHNLPPTVATAAGGLYRRVRIWVNRTVTSERTHVLRAAAERVASEMPPASPPGLNRTGTLGVMAVAAITSAVVSMLMTWNRIPTGEGGVQAVAAALIAPIPARDAAPLPQGPTPGVTAALPHTSPAVRGIQQTIAVARNPPSHHGHPRGSSSSPNLPALE